tara:strand:- start:923 stop:2758 length:1836 start_codon:yes stop_codon:yes gene_type:complete
MYVYKDIIMRTHYCGLINEKYVDQVIKLCGWTQRIRDHGGVIFIDLRDREGLIQVVCDPDNSDLFSLAETVRNEFCLQIFGKVRYRPEGTFNNNLFSGKVEVLSNNLIILNSSLTPPFQLDDENISETTRLTHRVLDLRRPQMQKNLSLRYKVTMEIRKFLDKNGFIDIETPMLTKSTPEGARDYLVPSRVNEGHFFALPQSPQLFKQLLMIANFDRYYQIAKCFRDEDLRADRQPEFTQIDCETSFMDEQEIRDLFEKMISIVFKNILDIDFPSPFPVMDFSTAVLKYGSDKPDLRVSLEIVELTDIMLDVSFKIFSEAAKMKNGRVACLVIPGGAVENSGIARSEIDSYTQFVAIYGAKGLAYIKVNDIESGREGLQSPIIKNLHDIALEKILKRSKAQNGDLIFFGADKSKIVNNSLGALREKIGYSDFGKENNLFKEGWNPLWIINFPMFELDENTNRWTALHHPFTAPKQEHEIFLETNPGNVLAQAYDLVLNGSEIGGGSVRIHKVDIQNKVFKALNISNEDAQTKFGFLLDALQYGAPPHGGIAFGLDRIVTMMTNADSIRDVIAFPKTQRAQCLLTEAPSSVDESQLKELKIKVSDFNLRKNN